MHHVSFSCYRIIKFAYIFVYLVSEFGTKEGRTEEAKSKSNIRESSDAGLKSISFAEEC